MRTTIRAAALAGTALAGLPAAAQDLTPVSYGTNWVAQAEHGGFYQSVADGTYEEMCNLDVTIVPGGPQVNNQALMLAGRIDFYMGGTLDAIFGVAEGLPLVNVAAMFQKEPQVLLTHPGRVSSFEDMATEGLTILTSDGAAYWEWMQAAYGFEAESREPYTFNAAPFIVDENKAMQGYLSSEPYAIEQETGWAPDVWLIADAGYTSYSTTIQTTRPFMEANPELVQCFVDASITGWYNYLYNDNSAANAMILSDNPDMTQDKIDFAIQAMIENGIVDSGDTLELGIGAMTDARMEDFYNKMVESGVVEGGLDYQAAYTTQFVNKGVGLELRPEG